MSTRCQVHVTKRDGRKLATLYHHCDGYPAGMLPLIEEGRKAAIALFESAEREWAEKSGREPRKIAESLDGRRVGESPYIANCLVMADPLGYEFEQGHELHGDIEYLYYVKGGANPLEWLVTVDALKWNGESTTTTRRLTDVPSDAAAVDETLVLVPRQRAEEMIRKQRAEAEAERKTPAAPKPPAAATMTRNWLEF